MKPNGLVIPLSPTPLQRPPPMQHTVSLKTYPLYSSKETRVICVESGIKFWSNQRRIRKTFNTWMKTALNQEVCKPTTWTKLERKAGVRREKEPCLLILHSFEITSESPPTRSTHWLVLTCYTAPVYGLKFAQFNPNEGLRWPVDV